MGDTIKSLMGTINQLQITDLEGICDFLETARKYEVIAQTSDFVLIDGVSKTGSRFYSIQGTLSGDVIIFNPIAIRDESRLIDSSVVCD